MELYVAGAASFGLTATHGNDAVLHVYVCPGEAGAFCGADAGKGADGDVWPEICEVCLLCAARVFGQLGGGGFFGRCGRAAGVKEGGETLRREGGDFRLMDALEFQRCDGVLHVDHAAADGVCK